MKIIKVVCGIIWKDGQVLIARRKPEKSLGGYWEFPGGKLEPNEDASSALVRELKEEMGMSVEKLVYFGSHVYNYETFSIELIGYQCSFVNASFQLTDHDEITFINPKQLLNYKMAPADSYFVELTQKD